MNIFKKNKKETLKEKIKNFWQKKKPFKKKKVESYSFKEVLIIMIFSIGIGAIMTISIINLNTKGNYFKNSKELNKLLEAYNTINNKYYGDLDKDKLIESAIDGMLSSVSDPYTTYIDSEEAESFMQRVNGKYQGIGCEIGMTTNSQIIIVNVFENTPASKAGLNIGDIVTKVDEKDFTGKTSTDVANYIKNSDKSKITMTILRNEEEKKITLERNNIEIPSVTSKTIETSKGKIGYLKISIFSKVTTEQFKNKLKELENANINSLIIDVRNNSGGYLDIVTDICDIFLAKNKIIYQLEDATGKEIKYSKTNEHKEYNIAVLVNKNSASASEILASAIKESYGGYVVGTNTYGKATVQQTYDMEDGSMIKYTTQRWLTPNGNFINEVGLEPTHYVELDKEYYKDKNDANDNQLQMAISLLSQ